MPPSGAAVVWVTATALLWVLLLLLSLRCNCKEARSSPADLRVAHLIFAIAIIAIASFHSMLQWDLWSLLGVIVPLSHVVAACRTRLMWRQAARPDQAHVVC